jgi:hypothetical protein
LTRSTLSKDHKEKVIHHLDTYGARLKKELYGGVWDKERKGRTKFYNKVFGKGHLEKLNESEFAQAIRRLWASQFWGNKDYLVNKILADNGIDKIRKALKLLLYGEEPLQERFDLFASSIKGLGTSSITEILSFVNPKEYGIWNDKPKNVLPLFGMKDILPNRVFKYQLDGKDYALCNEALKEIGKEMERYGFTDIDLLDVDILMWLLFLEVIKKEPKPEKPEKEKITKPKELSIDPTKLSHWDAMAILLQLGNLLGFETYTADPSRKSEILEKMLGEIALLKEIPPFTYQRHLDTVKNVDVIWFKDEFPAYCFEVEHTTGVTMGLLRLYQIRNFTNARFFVIAPSEIISKFQTEISKDPFHKIKNRYVFKAYEDLIEFFEEAKKYHELKAGFTG